MNTLVTGNKQSELQFCFFYDVFSSDALLLFNSLEEKHNNSLGCFDGRNQESI